MTGFIIFAIVLTLAYVLYYAAMITTDLAAQKKSAQTEEEDIDVGTNSQEVDDFATQHVVEDPSSGGFNFVTSQPKQEEHSSEIAEAEDETAGVTTDSIEESQYTTDSNSTSEVETETESEENEDNVEEPDESEEEIAESDDDDETSDENEGGFAIHEFSDEEPEPEKKAFKEEEAFDPSLRQKQYDVKKVYGPAASPEVQSHADAVNASTEAISTVSLCMTKTGLENAIRNNTADKYNIDYTHVQTKY